MYTHNTGRFSLEGLEARQLMTAGPYPEFLGYLKGTGSSRTFGVIYNSSAPINKATFDSTDIRVTGANNFSAFAVFTGSTQLRFRTGTVARYRIDGLAGGEYLIQSQSGSVADTNQATNAGRTIGAFRIGRRGRTVPINLDAGNRGSVTVLGTGYGSSTTPPPIDTNFGTVVQAINLGGGAEDLTTPNGILHFDALNEYEPGVPILANFGSLDINISSAIGGSDLDNAEVGGNPIFETEIYSGSHATEFLTITGLDPSKQYRFQFLHGDARTTAPYDSTLQSFKIDSGYTVTAPLEFGTFSGNELSNTTVAVSGTTSLSYAMPSAPSRGPSFSGVVISAASSLATPIIQPRAYDAGVFLKSSMRLNGSSRTFQVVYDDDQGVTATGLVGQTVLVTGPGGYSALASAVNFEASGANHAVVTYRIEGVDTTSRYSVNINGATSGSATLFYLVPDQWDTPGVSKRRRRR